MSSGSILHTSEAVPNLRSNIRSKKLENHIITSNNELSSGKDGDPLNFDEVDFFAFMTEQGYARQQLSKVRYGLKYLQTYSPLEQIIPQISNRKNSFEQCASSS